MKRFGLLLTALLAMAVLGGCGSDGTGESSGDNSSKESVTDSQASGSTVQEETEESSSEQESSGDLYGGSIVVGIQQDIDGLDPHTAKTAGTKEILFNIFEGLVKPDENGNMIGAVASEYTISEDGLVYTFTLRDGVKFHNGNAVTCEDVKYSLERVSGLLDGVTLMSTMKALQSVEILDEKTVQVKIGEANPELIYSFTAAIIPAGSGEDENANPVGTGPFSFVSYAPQEGVVVAKNPYYWQEGLPYLDQVSFKIVANAETAMMELQGGSIDIYPYLTETQAGELADDFQIVSGSSAVLQALFLNNAEKPLDDVRVRRAICYALDGDQINDFLYGGLSVLDATAMLPTLKSFYVDLNDTYGTSANVEKAKELLTEAGYPDGFELEIAIPSNYDIHMQTGEIIVEQLKAVGIKAVIKPVEWETWNEKVYRGREYQATISGLAGDMTPGYIINRFQTEASKNFVNFSNAEFDKVYAELLAVTDLEGRVAGYKRLQEIVNEEAASAFIQVPPTNTAVSRKLTGYKSYPVYVQDMSTVYFTEE